MDAALCFGNSVCVLPFEKIGIAQSEMGKRQAVIKADRLSREGECLFEYVMGPDARTTTTLANTSRLSPHRRLRSADRGQWRVHTSGVPVPDLPA